MVEIYGDALGLGRRRRNHVSATNVFCNFISVINIGCNVTL